MVGLDEAETLSKLLQWSGHKPRGPGTKAVSVGRDGGTATPRLK